MSQDPAAWLRPQPKRGGPAARPSGGPPWHGDRLGPDGYPDARQYGDPRLPGGAQPGPTPGRRPYGARGGGLPGAPSGVGGPGPRGQGSASGAGYGMRGSYQAAAQGPRSYRAQPIARPSAAAPIMLSTGSPPLTAFGVSVVLLGGCLIGAGLDLLLVRTAAWAITALFVAASAYCALKVRRCDWYSAVVGPPLAFACGLLLIAWFLPHDIGNGLVGALGTMLELLADKARVALTGTGIALVIVLGRRLPFLKEPPR